jgi:DNA-binding MarR family transcriptional regulator
LAQVARAVADFQTAVHVIDEAAAKRLGLNATDLRCLGVVADKGPVGAGIVARASDLSPGATTTALDRLQRKNYIRRRPNPADRRGVLVELTPKAQRIIRETYGPVGRAGVRSLGRYTDSQLALLHEFLKAGRDLQLDYAKRIAQRAIRSERALRASR